MASAEREPALDAQQIAAALEGLRPELTTYLTRLVVRPAVAEELVQALALRALESVDRAPAVAAELRPWLFRIATNLALDERRRHGSWREDLMLDAPRIVHESASAVEWMHSKQGAPELSAIAREHLTVCFACTLGQLPSEQAAALLLKEVYGFTVEEVAELLEARFAQAKNWLQAARASMEERYRETCALVRKEGVCHQCVQLDGFFAADRGDPLAGSGGAFRTRLRVLQDARHTLPGPWARLLTELLEEVQ